MMFQPKNVFGPNRAMFSLSATRRPVRCRIGEQVRGDKGVGVAQVSRPEAAATHAHPKRASTPLLVSASFLLFSCSAEPRACPASLWACVHERGTATGSRGILDAALNPKPGPWHRSLHPLPGPQHPPSLRLRAGRARVTGGARPCACRGDPAARSRCATIAHARQAARRPLASPPPRHRPGPRCTHTTCLCWGVTRKQFFFRRLRHLDSIAPRPWLGGGWAGKERACPGIRRRRAARWR